MYTEYLGIYSTNAIPWCGEIKAYSYRLFSSEWLLPKVILLKEASVGPGCVRALTQYGKTVASI